MNTKSIERNELKKYVELICDMEQNKYLQEKAIEQVKREIQRLSNPYVSSKPAAPVTKSTHLGATILTLIGLVFGFWTIGILFSGSIGLALFFGVIAFFPLAKGHDIREENKRITDNNKKALAYYNKAQVEYNTSVSNAQAQKLLAQNLKSRLSAMNTKLTEIKNDLDRAYSCNIIYPSYRNFVAVTSFRDYLLSGSCTGLEGHEGAYNKFDYESRLDKIITKLDVISNQLESIRYSQNSLYNAINTSNNSLERLQRSVETTNRELSSLSEKASLSNAQLEKLSYNSELTRFNTNQIRREVELRNRMEGILSYGWMN